MKKKNNKAIYLALQGTYIDIETLRYIYDVLGYSKQDIIGEMEQAAIHRLEDIQKEAEEL